MNILHFRKLCPVSFYLFFFKFFSNFFCFLGLSTQDPGWYTLLTSTLTPEQATSLQEVMVLAEQRKALRQSRQIEKNGGYAFPQQAVPSTFNFGSS